MAVLPGNGDGTFGAALGVTRASNFSFGRPLRIGDFNGDGKLDVLAKGGSSFGIWLNDGTGHFTLGSLITGAPARWELQAVGDFTGDGKLDVLFNDRTGDIPDYKLVVLPGDVRARWERPWPQRHIPGPTTTFRYGGGY